MSYRKVVFVFSAAALLLGGWFAARHSSVSAAAEKSYSQLPMAFEANAGQAHDAVKFIARGHGYQVFLTERDATLRLFTPQQNDETQLRLKFAVKTSSPVGMDELRTRSNYFIGNDPTAWRSDIRNFARVEYREVQPGVTAAFYGTQRALEYDFIVAPGVDPRDVSVTLEGADRIEALPNGDLRLSVNGAELIQRAPVSYQTIRGKRRNVTSRYVLLGGNGIGFAIDDDDYDASQPLTIDPVIDYSSFFGGIGSDEGLAIAIDASGNAYVTGTTYSNNFNTVLPLQTLNRGGKFDAFVTKLNPAGTDIIYSTYLGGSGEDSGQGIAVDNFGNAYVAGITNSADFNTRNPFQTTLNGQANDAFITKLNAQGTALIYSSYLGGGGIDQAFALAIDTGGNAYVAGSTASSDFPVQAALQPLNRGGADAFIAKVNAAGTGLVYATFLGGSSLDEAYAVAVDNAGNAYLAGGTASTDFNLANALQATNRGATDGFIAKVNVNGSQLLYSTYLGGNAIDTVYGLRTDAAGNAFLCGNTFSTDFPLANAIQNNNRGQSDAFITRLSANGATLLSSTYYGGANVDFARGIGLDANGQIYVAGRTASTDLTTVNALQAANRGNEDAFILKLNSAASQLLYATYLGGAREDYAFGLAVDGAGNAFITGDTRSVDFTTVNPLQPANRGGLDAFVTKLNPAGSQLTYSTYLGGAGEDLGLGIAIDTAGNAYITGYTSSNDYGTRNPLQATSRGGLEVFVTKILADNNDVAFNTYFGGNGSDTGADIAVDGSGNAYVTGATTSTNLPTRNPLQASNAGGQDAFVAKFNASGSTLIYSTYLGGNFGDEARGIATDLAGNAYLAGSTYSDNFPTRNAVQANARGLGDAFVTKLDSSGTQLVYSTYLGGTAGDTAADIGIDPQGNAYVVGESFSTDFNTRNPLQANNRGQQDAFAAKFSNDGSQMLYSTYLGGRRSDLAEAVAVDQSGNAYIAGATGSNDFPTANAFQTATGGGNFDAFVTKLNTTGAQIIYSTYLGGSSIDTASGIAVDAEGSAFITGLTNSLNFPRQSPLQADNRGGNEAFITRLSPAGSALFYSTYLGGSGDDGGGAIAVDSRGTAYLTGATSSPDFNIQFPLFAYGGGTDIFVAKILPDVAATLAPATLDIQPGGTGVLTLTLNPPQANALTVTLTSSNPSIATLPATITVSANTNSATLIVSGIAAGTATITATLPAAQGGGTASATVTVATVSSGGLEADVAPRPNGNGSLSIADWVQVGRFAAGLDTTQTAGEFQRADCAPRDARGNGSLSIADWVQAGRYAAGLDPETPTGGPSSVGGLGARYVGQVRNLPYDVRTFSGAGQVRNLPYDVRTFSGVGQVRNLPYNPEVKTGLAKESQQARVLRIVSVQLARGQQGVVTVEIDAQGNENGIGFSLDFDAAQLSFVNAAMASEAGSAGLNVNAAQAASGRIGFALAYNAGQSIAAGKRKLLTLTFNVAANASGATTAINFNDRPVTRELVNANAETLTATFTPGTLTLVGAVASVSAANYAANPLAPEQIIAAFGGGLASTTVVANSLPLPTTLAGTTVRVRDAQNVERLAPLFFVSANQVNYLMPAQTALGLATVTITNGDSIVSIGSVTIGTFAPGLFTANASGSGLAAAALLRVKADGSLAYENVARYDTATSQFVAIPIDLGPESDQVFLLLFGTGIRGRAASSPVTARYANTISGEVLYAGGQGDLVGLDQINVRVPRSLIGRGEVELEVSVDGRFTNAVRVAVK